MKYEFLGAESSYLKTAALSTEKSLPPRWVFSCESTPISHTYIFHRKTASLSSLMLPASTNHFQCNTKRPQWGSRDVKQPHWHAAWFTQTTQQHSEPGVPFLWPAQLNTRPRHVLARFIYFFCPPFKGAFLDAKRRIAIVTVCRGKKKKSSLSSKWGVRTRKSRTLHRIQWGCRDRWAGRSEGELFFYLSSVRYEK